MMNAERDLLFDFVCRMREAEQASRRTVDQYNIISWAARARAFDEIYTELKGMGFGQK